ncbi:hypothetical protein LEN26_000685 [Aphanomyces euteiches]|uniref:Copper transporter n=1 Tax=Aphanomyces euteiches TaxID=100861 RepID=A0A6G0XUP0_9STRA|nr:hypothetical protein Ae201684_000782 [Aphanomyces euteiches]KAH9099873.1 hypothetical protein Ae201684P_018881 [Aphanomyces euteiches]KAH9118177.1 hypothetical protein AeMF1_008526 [Aphanomyces euteiches]KAH9153543.1 hypothetical protein AeRB84_004233 [Aphanomyces euteiches]KAH9163022.1 hypothetical protein LEN26_000685 [Aphanomyces euteiches]
MEWMVWTAIETSCTCAMLFAMCVATSVVAQYCEFHFIRYAKQSSWIPEAFKSRSVVDQQNSFYEAFVLVSISVWCATVLGISLFDLPSRVTLGVVYSFYTGGLFGLAHFFKQNYLVISAHE